MEKDFFISQPEGKADDLFNFLKFPFEPEEPVSPIVQDAALVNYVMEALNKTSILHDLQILRDILGSDIEFRIVGGRLRDRMMEYIYGENIISVDVDVVVRCPTEVLYNLPLPGNLGRTSVGGLRRIFNGTQYDIRSMLNNEYIQATVPSYVVENPGEWRTFTDSSYKDGRPSIYAVLSTFSNSISKIALNPHTGMVVDMGTIQSIKQKRIEPSLYSSYETRRDVYAIAKMLKRYGEKYGLTSHSLYHLFDTYSSEMNDTIVNYMKDKGVAERTQREILALLEENHETARNQMLLMII